MAIAHGKPKHTYEEYAKLPEGERVELIEGEFLVSPAPRTRHQEILGRVYRLLCEQADAASVGKIFLAPTDVVFSKHDVVQPDILFISNERLSIITELNIQGAPDFIIEILSPGDEMRDTEVKKSLYEKHGVREYWIVDPAAQMITAYDGCAGQWALRKMYAAPEVIKSSVLHGLNLPLDKIFKA